MGVVADQLVKTGIDVNSPAGTRLTQELTTSVTSIQSADAKKQLGTQLQGVQNRAAGGQVTLFGNLRRIGGL